MLRKLIVAVAAASWLAISAGVGSSEEKSAEILAAEAAGLYLAASSIAEPGERGRLFYLVEQRLEKIRAAHPQSVIAAQIAFGRYGDIDVRLVEREARGWAAAHPSDAAALKDGTLAAADPAPAAAASGLVPSFGGKPQEPAASVPSFSPAGAGPATGGAAAPADRTFNVALLPTAPARLPPTDLVRRMRDAVVIIYNPVQQGAGTGFFISPRHLMTNTHVVLESDRLVIANKSIGVRSVHVLYRGMSSQGSGIDTAILETDGWESTAFLPFAEGVEEGEAITIGGYPGRASEADKAYDQFFRLIMENSLPTADAIPNVKFDFGYVQSIFVDAASGIENLQNGVNTSGGNSGSPIVNRCGATVGQHYSGSKAFLEITSEGKAVGDTSKFNFAISSKELRKFLLAASIPYTVAPGQCPQVAE